MIVNNKITSSKVKLCSLQCMFSACFSSQFISLICSINAPLIQLNTCGVHVFANNLFARVHEYTCKYQTCAQQK